MLLRRIELETDVLPLAVLVPAGMASLATAGASGIGTAQFLGASVFVGVLAETGPYRYSRNPMYVGVVGAVVGQGVAFESVLGIAVAGVVWILFRQMVLSYEEPLLRKQLGTPFGEYCRRVPRWIPLFG